MQLPCQALFSRKMKIVFFRLARFRKIHPPGPDRLSKQDLKAREGASAIGVFPAQGGEWTRAYIFMVNPAGWPETRRGPLCNFKGDVKGKGRFSRIANPGSPAPETPAP